MDLTADAVKELAALGKTYVPPNRVAAAAQPFAVLPSGLEIVDMEEYEEFPVRKRLNLTVCDAPSFVEYVDRHKEEGTLLTCSIKGLKVEAVIDSHSAELPGWGEHRCTLQLERSPDWDKWKAVDGKAMSQGQFADFLLEMDHTIAEPDAATIIEVATKLQLESSKKFESKVNMTDGSFTFHYSDEAVQTKGQMKMPDKCTVDVAPFRGAKPVRMLALIRYRLNEGKLALFFKLVRPEDAVEEAFEQVVETVKAGILLPVLRQA